MAVAGAVVVHLFVIIDTQQEALTLIFVLLCQLLIYRRPRCSRPVIHVLILCGIQLETRKYSIIGEGQTRNIEMKWKEGIMRKQKPYNDPCGGESEGVEKKGRRCRADLSVL